MQIRTEKALTGWRNPEKERCDSWKQNLELAPDRSCSHFQLYPNRHHYPLTSFCYCQSGNIFAKKSIGIWVPNGLESERAYLLLKGSLYVKEENIFCHCMSRCTRSRNFTHHLDELSYLFTGKAGHAASESLKFSLTLAGAVGMVNWNEISLNGVPVYPGIGNFLFSDTFPQVNRKKGNSGEK